MTSSPGDDEVVRAEAQVHASADGRAFSLSAALVRFPDGARGATLLRSSLTDVDRRRCATLSLGERRLPTLLRERFARESDAPQPLVRRALEEMLAAGRLPYPDMIADPAELGSRMLSIATGAVELRLAFPDASIVADLVIAPLPSPIASTGRLSSWVPCCDVQGTISIDGVSHAIARGHATYFEAVGSDDDRITIHLDDATAIHIWREADRLRAIIAGETGQHDDATLTPLTTWTSFYTFHDYAVAWRLEIPSARVELELRAAFPDQEIVTVTSSKPLWQGRCDVSGTIASRRVSGVALVQQAARDAAATLPELFASIPRQTRRVIQQQFPLPLTFENVLAMLGDDTERYVRDVDLEELERILIRPIREILDRMGKAWRSYTAVVCYHALRGDRWRQDVIDVLLGLAEVIHVGSLIVDDVEDASPTRRNGPACHVAHGVPTAINAGTFCYFAWQAWFARLAIPAEAKLQIYEIYFEFMRMAHVGQGLDIQGFTREMIDEIVATGDVVLLARQMKNVYMLKTGAPASVFARMGAIVAGGGEAQVRGLSDLFEALGIAFQIMDDVQNLKGFQGDPKHCEDLAQAKVTMPVLEAMRVLELRERRELWDQIRRCGEEPALVPSIIEKLEQCGAFTACRDQAHVLLDDAWHAAAPLLEDSVAKIMLRSFCLYVVESLG